MAQRDRADVKKALCNKGFIEEDNDHYFYTLTYKEKTQHIYTKISKGSSYKAIHQGLLSLMSRQLKLSNSQFLDFIDCKINYDDYISILKEKKIIE